MEEGENQQPSKELIAVQNVHERLIGRFGQYRTSGWQPSPDNVSVLGDQEFDDKWVELMSSPGVSEEETRLSVKNAVGFAHFGSQTLYVRASGGENPDLEQTMAHEMLHLWFLRSELIKNERGSYDVNETFVDTLALEGLGLFDVPKEERTAAIDGAINNAILVKSVIEKMGERGWQKVFEVCQNGDEWDIRKLTKEVYGANPPTKELRKLNDNITPIYGRKFWDRFKEAALAVYLIRGRANFQRDNPEVDYTLGLVSEWAGVTSEVEKELDKS